MKKGINFEYILKNMRGFGEEDITKAMELCQKHDFKYLDYLPDITRADYLENARALKRQLQKYGLRIWQSHAPMFRYEKELDIEHYKECLSKTIDVAKEVGAKYVVVHGDEYRWPEVQPYDVEKVLSLTHELFAPFVEQAKEKQISIAFESLFEESHYFKYYMSPRFTSDVDHLIALVESFGEDSGVCICWDFGHAKVQYEEKAFKAFQKAFKYIKCTHVHDNTSGDNHLIPTLGDMDWQKYGSYMRENGYEGVLSFEFAYGHIPPQLMDGYLAFLQAVGEYLGSIVEKD